MLKLGDKVILIDESQINLSIRSIREACKNKEVLTISSISHGYNGVASLLYPNGEHWHHKTDRLALAPVKTNDELYLENLI